MKDTQIVGIILVSVSLIVTYLVLLANYAVNHNKDWVFFAGIFGPIFLIGLYLILR